MPKTTRCTSTSISIGSVGDSRYSMHHATAAMIAILPNHEGIAVRSGPKARMNVSR